MALQQLKFITKSVATKLPSFLVQYLIVIVVYFVHFENVSPDCYYMFDVFLCHILCVGKSMHSIFVTGNIC